MNKLAEHISVLNEYTSFGTTREEGTIIYDITNKKTYVLTASAYAKECLNSTTTKKELYSVDIALGVADNTTVFGFVNTGSGSVTPSSFYGVDIKRMGGDDEVTGFSIEFVGGVKINSVTTLSATIEGYGNVTLTWKEPEDIYYIFDAALLAYMQGEVGNTISVILKF